MIEEKKDQPVEKPVREVGTAALPARLPLKFAPRPAESDPAPDAEVTR